MTRCVTTTIQKSRLAFLYQIIVEYLLTNIFELAPVNLDHGRKTTYVINCRESL